MCELISTKLLYWSLVSALAIDLTKSSAI